LRRVTVSVRGMNASSTPGSETFENSGRRKFSKYDGLRLGTGASASKSGEFGYALLVYQCYSHLVEWLVVAE
jgi:hypothetical protein